MEKDFVITGIKRIVYVGEEEYPEKVTHFGMSAVQNELIFTFSGQNTVYFNGKALKTLPGTVRFLPEGRVYEYVVDREVNGACIDIVFTADRVISKDAFITSPILNQKLPALFKKAFSIWVAKGEGYRFECISLLYKIFAELCKESYLPDADFKKIEPAVTYINENFLSEKLSAEGLAKRCGISYAYLKRLFIRRFGMPPKRYVISLKINLACDLLRSEMYSVSQVAEMSGYDDIYFFSRQFKEYIGISPTEFIKKFKSSK